MPTALLWINLGLAGVAILLLVFLLLRSGSGGTARLDQTLREELRAGREESANAARSLREELTKGLQSTSEALNTSLSNLVNLQRGQLESVATQLSQLTESNQKRLEQLRQTVDEHLLRIGENNERKLSEIREMVAEKLETTLQTRLGESFNLVSERLEAVHRGLGEMQTLATGVGDLKRMLTNVKTRGLWGEIQLGALLEQLLTPDQYGCNVCLNPERNTFVEFAVRLPGPEDNSLSCVWLPIDAKFPLESYLQLLEASETADPEAVATANKSLITAVRKSAKDIHDKYIDPPHTTDFAILFLPTESLYAEVARQTGLLEELQNNFRVVIAGPTTLAALLNSLRLGFKTLALQKKASEVWTILASVKTEFKKFGEVLEKARNQLKTVTKTLEDEMAVRARAMERKLRSVEELPASPETNLLAMEKGEEENEK